MKGFFRYLPPFSPDYSGAVSALFSAGGMVVLCDPGGCSGNVAGYDEPRFYGGGGVFYSAAIRELDTIFGRDDKLVKKIAAAAAPGGYSFIALVGTPAVSVIGTDLGAVARAVEKETGLPSFAVAATGMEDYSAGEQQAEAALTEKFLPEAAEPSRGLTGVFGAIPLNAAGGDDLVSLMKRGRTVFFSEKGAADALRHIGRFERLVCLSPSGIRACELIRSRFGIPFEMAYPESPALEKAAAAAGDAEKILIIHQQAAANTLRRMIRETSDADVAVGSFFLRLDAAAEEQDPAFSGEDELARAADGCDLVIADPMYRRALASSGARLAPLPHIALSGDLYR